MGNRGRLTWVRHCSHKSRTAPIATVLAVFSCVKIMVWLPLFRIFNTCTDTDAYDCTWGLYGYRNYNSLHWSLTGRKKKLAAQGDLNPHQYCIWLFSQTFYHLSYPCPNASCSVMKYPIKNSSLPMIVSVQIPFACSNKALFHFIPF